MLPVLFTAAISPLARGCDLSDERCREGSLAGLGIVVCGALVLGVVVIAIRAVLQKINPRRPEPGRPPSGVPDENQEAFEAEVRAAIAGVGTSYGCTCGKPLHSLACEHFWPRGRGDPICARCGRSERDHPATGGASRVRQARDAHTHFLGRPP